MTAVGEDVEGLAAIRARAVQRFPRRYGLRLVGMVVLILGYGVTNGALSGRSSGGHGDTVSRVAMLAVLGLVLIGCVLMIPLMRRRLARDVASADVEIELGLDCVQRSEVLRGVRDGRPSVDPVLRTVETEVATRLAKPRRPSAAVFAMMAVAFIAYHLIWRSGAQTWLSIALVAIVAAIVGRRAFLLQRARRYLTT